MACTIFTGDIEGTAGQSPSVALLLESVINLLQNSQRIYIYRMNQNMHFINKI